MGEADWSRYQEKEKEINEALYGIELDQENKRRLINFLPDNHQIIITDTDADSLMNVKKYKLIRLQRGLNG